MRIAWLLMGSVLLIGSIWLAGCSPADEAAPAAAPTPAEASRPSLLLVTLDTTRADRIGAYGYAEAQTPHLDRLAQEGIRFEMARAVVPVTLPSHASILTGVIPPTHGVRDNGVFVLGPEALLLSEVLRDRGFRTGAFVSSYVLDPRFGLDQGFEVYRAPTASTVGATFYVERPADQVIDDAVAWLSSLGDDEPFFAWVHLYDPHAPHHAPAPWARAHADLYDAEIAFCDAQIGRLLRWLEDRPAGRNLWVAVTADHGESFGEHGEKTHGALLYDATLRVPLILSGPGVADRAGSVVRRSVSNVALAPTLLEAVGIEPSELPAATLPSLLARDGADEPIYVETLYPYHSFHWHALRGLVSEDLKLIEGKEPELYDLAADPGELENLASEKPELLARLEAQLAGILESTSGPGWAEGHTLDPAEQAALEALGYLEASTGGDPFDPSLPDARERVGDLETLERAAALTAEAAHLIAHAPPSAWQRREAEQRARELREQARSRLLELHERNPEDAFALQRLANVEIGLGNCAAAVRLLETVVRVKPSSSTAFYNLGLCLGRLGRRDEGMRALHRAIELQPRQPHFHLQLGVAHLEGRDWDAGRLALLRVEELISQSDPMRPKVEAMLTRIERERQTAEE